MLARFLHYFPQYTLADLRGGLGFEDFAFLYGGMMDIEHPEAMESFEERMARKTREAHLAACGRG